MKKFFVLTLLFAYALCADPILAPYINEFQTSPDSLQRIEVAYYDEFYEWLIVTTNTCSCFVDSPFVSDHFALIDMENTNGDLDLNDTCDTIIVFFGDLWFADTVIYPDTDTVTYPAACLFAPEPYTSASNFEYDCDWYIDSTPTFGAENDDYPYCTISGAVFNLDSVPLEAAAVRRRHYSTTGWFIHYTNEDGLYSFTSQQPGDYILIASHLNYQPETTRTSTYALFPAEDINFYLSPGYGINEEITEIFADLVVYPNPFSSKMTIDIRLQTTDQNQRSSVSSLPSSVCIFDLTGRLIRTFSLPPSPFPSLKLTWDGRDDEGIEVPPGVYFVKYSGLSFSRSKAICKLR